MLYKGYKIEKRNQNSRYGNWEVFKDGTYCAQFHTRKEAKQWIDPSENVPENSEQKLRSALQLIADAPFTMVNDSESLRHTIKHMQFLALEALKK